MAPPRCIRTKYRFPPTRARYRMLPAANETVTSSGATTCHMGRLLDGASDVASGGGFGTGVRAGAGATSGIAAGFAADIGAGVGVISCAGGGSGTGAGDSFGFAAGFGAGDGARAGVIFAAGGGSVTGIGAGARFFFGVVAVLGAGCCAAYPQPDSWHSGGDACFAGNGRRGGSSGGCWYRAPCSLSRVALTCGSGLASFFVTLLNLLKSTQNLGFPSLRRVMTIGDLEGLFDDSTFVSGYVACSASSSPPWSRRVRRWRSAAFVILLLSWDRPLFLWRAAPESPPLLRPFGWIRSGSRSRRSG